MLSTSHSLLQRAGRLEPAAWERLCALYGPIVHGWCRRHGLQESDAADAVQEVFRAVFLNLGQFLGQGGVFHAWLWTITANQVRMAFLIAAASDKEAGYFEQKGQIASIIAGAFGWRALARELAGKIPLGGGLVAKAAIAYAGTFAVGRSLERFHRIGYGLTREEQEAVYRQAFERGKRIAESIWKRKQPAVAPVEGEG